MFRLIRMWRKQIHLKTTNPKRLLQNENVQPERFEKVIRSKMSSDKVNVKDGMDVTATELPKNENDVKKSKAKTKSRGRKKLLKKTLLLRIKVY